TARCQPVTRVASGGRAVDHRRCGWCGMSAQIGHLTLDQARSQLRCWEAKAAPISAAEHQQRIEHARALMQAQGVDALLVNAGTSLRYLGGVPGGAAERLVALLVTRDGDPVMICPAFEEGSLDAVLRVPASKRLWEEHEDPHALVAQVLAERGASTLALDPGAAFVIHTGLSRHLDRAN